MTAEPVTTVNGSMRDVAVPRPAPIGRRVAVVALTVGAVLNLSEALIIRGLARIAAILEAAP